MDKLTINMSLINRLFYHGDHRQNVCLKKVKAIAIDKTISDKPNDSMMGGLYFEGMCLGESAGHGVTDLPRKPKGEKTIKQERIDMQHLNFKIACVNNFVNVQPLINTQIRIYKRFSDYIDISGTLDLFPTTMLYNGTVLPMTLIDLKLTADLDSTFGEYSWGRFEEMDHTQLTMYSYLLRDFDVDLNTKMGSKMITLGLWSQQNEELFQDVPTFYWVFEHGVKMRNQIFKVNQDAFRRNELKEVIRKTASLIDDEFSKDDGWAACPSYGECKMCPLNYMNGGTCREAQIIKEV